MRRPDEEYEEFGIGRPPKDPLERARWEADNRDRIDVFYIVRGLRDAEFLEDD